MLRIKEDMVKLVKTNVSWQSVASCHGNRPWSPLWGIVEDYYLSFYVEDSCAKNTINHVFHIASISVWNAMPYLCHKLISMNVADSRSYVPSTQYRLWFHIASIRLWNVRQYLGHMLISINVAVSTSLAYANEATLYEYPINQYAPNTP